MWRKEIWLVASTSPAEGIRTMEHEGDFDKGDVLLHITVDERGINTRMIVASE